MANVYFSRKITPETVNNLLYFSGISNVVRQDDFSAIKIHFGERGNKGYIKPEFVRPVVKSIKKLKASPFLTDANTIYLGARSDSVNHMLLAYGHGFGYEKVGCPVIIADGLRGNSYVEVDITSGYKAKPKIFSKVKVANAIYYSDSIICMSHFKGHMGTGFAGALKNIGMGCASRAGKYEQHNAILPKVKIENCTSCGLCMKWCPGKAVSLPDKKSKIVFEAEKCIGCGECFLVCKFRVFSIPWSAENFQERMVEYCAGVLKDKRVIYINFLNNITKNCDCVSKNEESLTGDVGILSSTDIVAIDQASVDLINKSYGSDFFKSIWPEIDYSVQLEYAERLGLGSRKYEIKEI